MSRAALCALGLGLMLTGCANPTPTLGPMTGLAADPFPAPDIVQVAPYEDHKIIPGDTVSVTVFQVPELARSGQVASTGTFFVPKVGDVAIGGKTSEQAAAAIAAALSPRYIVNPQVTVAVQTSNVQHFTIEGAVTAPGIYDAADNMTLLQAIATAKGTTLTSSDVRQVVVFRTINGQKSAYVYDVSQIRLARAVDPKIYANDLINVPVDNRADTIKTIIGTIPTFALFAR